jgi:hypothetical protein
LARAPGSVGTGVLLAPHWLFDCMGRFLPQIPVLKATALAAASVSHHQRGKNRVQESRQDARDMQRCAASPPRTVIMSSRLREQQAGVSDGAISEESSDYDSASSAVSADLDALSAPRRNARTKPGEIPFWNSGEVRLRSKTPSIWSEVCNGVCSRKPILRELRDHLSELDSRQPPAVARIAAMAQSVGPCWRWLMSNGQLQVCTQLW